MPRAKRTSASFNPRLLLALEEGCKREIKLPCQTAREAIRCRQEINKLRSALREENRTGWQNYSSAGLYIDPKNPTVVIIKPKAEEFRAALDLAGIPDPALPAPRLDTNPDTSDEQAFFNDLKKLTGG